MHVHYLPANRAWIVTLSDDATSSPVSIGKDSRSIFSSLADLDRVLRDVDLRRIDRQVVMVQRLRAREDVDPTDTLRCIRDIALCALTEVPDGIALPDASAELVDLAELVMRLDAWLSTGGFLPRQWRGGAR